QEERLGDAAIPWRQRLLQNAQSPTADHAQPAGQRARPPLGQADNTFRRRLHVNYGSNLLAATLVGIVYITRTGSPAWGDEPAHPVDFIPGVQSREMAGDR